MKPATRLSLHDLAAALMAERAFIDGQAQMERFVDDPVGFITEILGERCWSKQAEIARAVRDFRFVAVPSCHASGKSWVMARIALWWILSHKTGEAFVVVSAPTDQQVRSILWREMKRAHERGLPGVLTQSEWRIGGQLVAMGRKPADYSEASFQGIHDKHVLVVLDEASGIKPGLWTQAETLVANAGSRMVVIGNPDDPTGAFAKACRHDSIFKTIRISAFDTPSFTGEAVVDEIREGLISPIWVQERSESWGEGSNLYRAKVLAQFPDQREDSVFHLSWIERARELELTAEGPARLGVDVGRYGPSESVIYCLRGSVMRRVAANRGESTSQTMGRIIRALSDEGAMYAMVDEVGVGGGVVDALEAEGYPVYGLNGATRSNDPQRFANFRAEAYWGARKLLEKGAIDLDPEDEELAEQLSLIRYRVNHRGQIQIESKEDMRRQGRTSPDRADAFVLATIALSFPSYDPEEEEREYEQWRREIRISAF